MNILDILLGRDDKRGGDGGISGLIGRLSRGVIGCGCLLVAVAILGIVLLVTGRISIDDQVVTVIVVIIMIIVATVSMLRSSLGY